MYRVREDGLQTANASATHSSLVCPRALPRRKPIAWGIFGMNEPNITCPHCKAKIGLAETLTAPLIQATHKNIAEREREVARRESAIQGQRAELARAVELAEQQLTTRLKTERAIAAEEAKKAQLSELESKSQEVAHLRRELQERETNLAEAKNAEAELIRKQGELEDEKRELNVQIERVQKSLSEMRDKAKQDAEARRLNIMEKEEQIASMQRRSEDLQLIYQYLTGPRFRQRIEAIVERVSIMETDLERERKTMTRLRAKREGQIKSVIESTVGMYGDLKEIAGQSLEEIDGLSQIARRVEARRKRGPTNHRMAEPARGRTH